MIKDENYIVIQGFMVNELKLKGTELLVYAIIYGFSQDGETQFTGSWNYLARWCNTTRQSIYNALRSLTKKGLIEGEKETKNNVKFVSYRVVKKFDYQSKKFTEVVKKFDGVVKKVHRGSKNFLPNNIDNNINNNLDINRKNERKEIFEYDWLNDNEL